MYMATHSEYLHHANWSVQLHTNLKQCCAIIVQVTRELTINFLLCHHICDVMQHSLCCLLVVRHLLCCLLGLISILNHKICRASISIVSMTEEHQHVYYSVSLKPRKEKSPYGLSICEDEVTVYYKNTSETIKYILKEFMAGILYSHMYTIITAE